MSSGFALAGLVCGFLISASVAMVSDPLDDVKRFSDFPAADLRHVFDGDILGTRGSLMNFPNGLSAQTCFVTGGGGGDGPTITGLGSVAPRHAEGVRVSSGAGTV